MTTATQDQDESVRERRLRREADRRGWAVRKSRRDGTYMMIDRWTNTIVAYNSAWPYGYGLDLDDIDDALSEQPTQ